MDYVKLEKILLKNNGNITRTATQLGIPRETCRYHCYKMLSAKTDAALASGTVPAVGRTVDLIISDTQFPFHHQNTMDFLAAVKEEFKPTRIFHVGDLVDSYRLSFHEQDPTAPSLTQEMEAVQEAVADLAELFPTMYIAEGNHDMRLYRSAAKAGIPRGMVRGLNELIGAPSTWYWRPKWDIEFSNGERATMVHNCGHKDAIKGVQSYGQSIIQGHYATQSVIQYVSNRDKLMWGMTVGASIDDEAVCFAYNKLDIRRPILSHAIVENGVPRLLPMKLDRNARWVGTVIA